MFVCFFPLGNSHISFYSSAKSRCNLHSLGCKMFKLFGQLEWLTILDHVKCWYRSGLCIYKHDIYIMCGACVWFLWLLVTAVMEYGFFFRFNFGHRIVRKVNQAFISLLVFYRVLHYIFFRLCSIVDTPNSQRYSPTVSNKWPRWKSQHCRKTGTLSTLLLLNARSHRIDFGDYLHAYQVQ